MQVGSLHSLSPPVSTVRIGADIVEPHFVLGSPGLGLEEDGFTVATLGAVVVLRTGQGGVMHHVRHNLRQLIDFMSDLVDIDAVIVRYLLVVAVPASIEQNTVFFVLLRIEHVVAFLTEFDSYEAGALIADAVEANSHIQGWIFYTGL